MADRSRVLVTGGAGFIGRRVVRALLAEGHEVTVADLRAFPDPEVRSVTGDLCDPGVPERAVSPGTDAIIHLAALTSVLASVNDPVSTYRLNVDATARLLEQARENEVGAFLLASTNAVTGNVGSAVITEQTVLRPLIPYGATKAAAEMLLSAYANCYGIAGAALRFSNVYGPGMGEKDSFIPRLMRAARDGEGVQVRGDGTMLRDVVHVDDVVQGVLAAWRARHTGPLILGSGQSVSVNDMVDTARRVTGAPIPVEHVPVPKRRDAGRGGGHLGGPGDRVRALARPGIRHGHGLARLPARKRGDAMIYSNPRDQAVDDAAVAAFTESYGERATSLPPVAIVIAAYNEAGAIGPVIEELPAEVCGLATTVIVVADGCADGTAKEAMTAGAMVADVPVNRGQGAALRLGYRLARDGGAAYIVTTDADGQYNPAEIERVLAPVVAGEADFVTGSRRLGSQETHDFIRRAGVLFFAGSLSLLTGQKISDTTFGLRAMRSEVTGAVRLEQPQYQASELLIGVITHGYKVAEVPATIHRRRIGESKKGQNPLYGLHLPGVNNLFYGIRFARVIYGTWWRERQRSRSASGGRSESSASPESVGPGGEDLGSGVGRRERLFRDGGPGPAG